MAGTLSIRKVKTVDVAPLSWRLRNWLRWGFVKGWLAHNFGLFTSKLLNVAVLLPELKIRLFHQGRTIDYGTVGYQKVTTAFCELMVAQLQTETSVWGDFKYHDSGVGATGEQNTDTGIETTDGQDRSTGTQTTTSTVIYKSVGTISYTGTYAVTEHGLFNTTNTATLMDRTVFSAVNVVSGDSVEFTYSLTVTAGG
jgi:hypothetical protein